MDAVRTGLILLGGFVYRTVRALAKSCSHASWRLRSLEERLEVAKSFAQWQSLADDLDAIRDEQSRNSSSARQPQLYDESLLRAKVTELQELRATGQVEKLVSALRADLFRDFGNSTNKVCHIQHCAHYPLLRTDFRRYAGVFKLFYSLRDAHVRILRRLVAACGSTGAELAPFACTRQMASTWEASF